jgi:sulfoxide reductase catalytic subunit YedY
MANVIIPPGWRIPERNATPRELYLNRRDFLKRAGLGAAAAGISGCGSSVEPIVLDETPLDERFDCSEDPPTHPLHTICSHPNPGLYPPSQISGPPLPFGALSERFDASTICNFYEFIGNAADINSVWGFTGPFEVWPWTVQVVGEVEVTGTFDIAPFEREFGLEERIYRHRCVEAWSMAVPWVGYPLRKLIEKFRPLSSANYVRFVSFDRPDQAIGQFSQPWYPWPFFEALRMDEALHDLAWVATGMYGEPLTKQNGAPWRLAIPWKYGFKSLKSISRIEFLREEPSTFWPEVGPEEYGFYSNVNPAVAHPRWSQAEEMPIGTSDIIPTQFLNGYAEYVEDLYDPVLHTYIS